MIQLNTSQPSVQRKGEGEENLHPLNPVCNKSNNTSRSFFTPQCCEICIFMFVSLLTFWEPVLQMLLLYLKKHVPQIFYYHVKASKQTKESSFLNPLPTKKTKKT